MSSLFFTQRTRYSRSAARRGAAGTSLIETLIAAAILLVIAVSIFPMFHRAVTNNISGADASLATQHGRSRLEGMLAVPIDNDFFSMSNPILGHTVQSDGSGDRLRIDDLYWDDQANVDPPMTGEVAQRLAPGAWIDEADVPAAEGQVVWQRTTDVRQYSYADISEGVIDVETGQITTAAGHPQLFDSPLSRSALTARINFREEDVAMTSRRSGLPFLRTRFVRTY